MENETEQNKSKLVNDRIDLKALTVGSFATVIDFVNSGKIQSIQASDTIEIVILTNFGLVTGDCVFDLKESYDDDTMLKDFNKFMFSSMVKHRNELVSKFESEEGVQRLTNDTGFVYLKNAVIRPFTDYNNALKFGDLCLFSDQITGFSMKAVSE